eukprot:scaffold3718_cov131-Amphora_coffeaeformis.AAC.2
MSRLAQVTISVKAHVIMHVPLESECRPCGNTHCVRAQIVLRLAMSYVVACTVSVEGTVEEAIKLVRVMDGVDQCTVGFVPRVLMSLPAVKNQMNKFVQVTELYHDSDNTYKKDKSYKNCGIAWVITLDDEGQNE